uniref:Uncharacterized protein n=1 Tax=Sphaerodactylus townsendi TaxID=933632 RepID=A0ACB8E9R9_9SAUR
MAGRTADVNQSTGPQHPTSIVSLAHNTIPVLDPNPGSSFGHLLLFRADARTVAATIWSKSAPKAGKEEEEKLQ